MPCCAQSGCAQHGIHAVGKQVGQGRGGTAITHRDRVRIDIAVHRGASSVVVISLRHTPVIISYAVAGCRSGLPATSNGIRISSLMTRLLILNDRHDSAVALMQVSVTCEEFSTLSL